MHNKFAEQTIKIEVDVANKISPFYYNSGISFYKNRLIHVEDIIEQKEVNKDNSVDFQSFETKIYHLLTFQDEMGNTHKYRSSIKPKNIGDTMYYVVENGEIKDIFSEHNKNGLKKYLTVKGEYKYSNIIYKCCYFYIKNFLKIFVFGTPICSIMLIIFNAFPSVNHDRAILSVLLSIHIIAFSFMPFIFLGHIHEEKANKFISDKEDKEKETLLETFE